MCSVLLCGNFHRFCNIHRILSKKAQLFPQIFMSKICLNNKKNNGGKTGSNALKTK